MNREQIGEKSLEKFIDIIMNYRKKDEENLDEFKNSIENVLKRILIFQANLEDVTEF
jgi:hypothetical protein